MRTSSSGTFLLPSLPQAITLLEWTYSCVLLLSNINIHFVKGNKKRRIHTYSKENEFWWNLFYGHRPLVRKPISGKHLVYASIHLQAKYIQHWCCLILRDLIWLHFLCSNFPSYMINIPGQSHQHQASFPNWKQHLLRWIQTLHHGQVDVDVFHNKGQPISINNNGHMSSGKDILGSWT